MHRANYNIYNVWGNPIAAGVLAAQAMDLAAAAQCSWEHDSGAGVLLIETFTKQRPVDKTPQLRALYGNRVTAVFQDLGGDREVRLSDNCDLHTFRFPTVKLEVGVTNL